MNGKYSNVSQNPINKIKQWCANHIAPGYVGADGNPVNLKEVADIERLVQNRPVGMTCEQKIEFNYWRNMFKYISTYQLHRHELQGAQPGCLDSNEIMLYHYTGMGAMTVPSITTNLFQAGVMMMSLVSALLQIIKANDTGGISVYAQLSYMLACVLSMLYLYNISKVFTLLQLGCLAVSALTIYGVSTSEETKDTAWSHFP
jgi:hypothetical protein